MHPTWAPHVRQRRGRTYLKLAELLDHLVPRLVRRLNLGFEVLQVYFQFLLRSHCQRPLLPLVLQLCLQLPHLVDGIGLGLARPTCALAGTGGLASEAVTLWQLSAAENHRS